MKKILLSGLLLCFCAVLTNAQTTDKSLEAAMKNFVTSINRKNSTAFLSYISKTGGLTIMNTIDQGEAGNADKPMFVETLKYAALAADFKKKGDNYRSFFLKSEYDPNFYNSFSSPRTRWKDNGGSIFMPIRGGRTVKTNYVKWEKEDGRWTVVEVGLMIS